jgi:hypothetical protein
MMLFLIDYDRKPGRIIRIESFSDSDRKKASESRLELELELYRQGIDREVVLLEAVDEAAIRRTHRRYFANLAELTQLPKSDGQ